MSNIEAIALSSDNVVTEARDSQVIINDTYESLTEFRDTIGVARDVLDSLKEVSQV